MAKKKKKQTIKINNKIKELMNGEPFDEGIKYLDENILIELTMILDLKVPMLTKKEMVKALRRVWSEGNVSLRLNILNYLEQLGVKSSKEINKQDKVSYILTILENFEYTKEEENAILSAFIDSNFSKITKDKIKNKLKYIRQAKKIKKWEDILDVKFNNLSQIEFYHSYTFDMSQESFNKSLLTQTQPIDTKILNIENDEEIKKVLEEYKEDAIEKKNQEIDTFLTIMINKGHRYLKPHEINQLVRQMPPEDDCYSIDIPLDILKRIIKSIDEEYRVVVEGETIYITKDKLYPIYNKELPYTVLVTSTRNFIYRLIWKEEELPTASDLAIVKSENKRDFEITIMELEEELEHLSDGLELDHKIIEKYILRFIEPQITSSHSLKI
ncbi:MAG: helicase, partial [Sulfurovaceae bacterium]|nr:helicase [Sulfurovaceae bacterium]